MRNGKRNLELATMKKEQITEPNCVSMLNKDGKLDYVIVNNEFKTKKAGGICKITLDEKLMKQLLDFYKIIRPKFATVDSKNFVWLNSNGSPFSAESMSRVWSNLNQFYDGHGSTTNQNFRQQFGRNANVFGSDKERRHAMDQQDHGEGTTSRYYEQSAAVSVSAVNVNKEFQEKANILERKRREAQETMGREIQEKMKQLE